MWDQRYDVNEYVYGTKPNDFLRQNIDQLPKGKILTIAEGEGRNAVYLAQQGFQVTAVDASITGLKKAEKLAEQHQVDIELIHADLANFDFGVESWHCVVSIFCPLPPVVRQNMYKKLQQGLRPNGVFLIEAYTPEQIAFDTGGGKDPSVMQTKMSLLDELKDLTFHQLDELKREVIEGSFHTGLGAVVQGIAVKHI